VFLIPSPTEDAIKARIPEFESQTGIKVNVVDAPYDQAHQKMLLSFQAKQGAYDVVQFDNPYLAPFASQNVLEDLGPYTAKSTAYDISDFVQPLQDYNKYNGVSVALNLSTEPFILWYRTDIYSKLGLSVPTTWEQYFSNAKKIQDSGLGSGQIIANNSSVNSWWWLQLLWSFGGDLQDGSGAVTVNTPEAAKATEYMKALLDVSPKSAITATGDDATTLFSTQDVGQMINYSGYYPVVTDPKSSKVIGKFGTAVIPVGPSNITELTGWNIGMPADSKNKDAAWQFLDWLLSKDNTPKLMDAGAAAIGRTSIVNNTAITDKQPYIKLLGPAAESGRRLPALTQWGQASNQIGVAVQDMLTGKTTTADGLAALQDELTTTLGN
jgi:ABC-type glycerol-3-phosphate transport system substrate-binding protein